MKKFFTAGILGSTLLSLILVFSPAQRVQAQDLTTMLSKFLVDLRSGSLGVNQPITNITATGNVSGANVLASGTFSTTGRTFFAFPANGTMRISQNSGATGTQLFINVGTANPTVTSCGTGAVTTNSTNTAGEVTPTGASDCTLTFGLPNWSNTPFCIVTPETTLEAMSISAISVTAFTAHFTTAANKFMYHCFGGL